jgi:hypothetical protein
LLTLLLAVLAAIPGTVVLAENIDPVNRFAWGENVGWLNSRPQVEGDPGIQVGDFDLTGWMWGENIGWVSLTCENNHTCDAVDYGVHHDGSGVLGGHAWGENIGWVSFSCENTLSCGAVDYGVRIDPMTGDFSGQAWSENAGWIRFASSGPNPFKVNTEWRCAPPPPPIGTPDLDLEKLPGGAEVALVWTSVPGGSGHDVAFGELTTLLASGLAASTLACLSDNDTAQVLVHPDAPPLGDAFWYLVRGVNCGSSGTYDTGEPGQITSRDPSLAACD